MAAKRQAHGQTLKVVETAFEIIETLRELDGTGVTELANHLDMPKSTVHSYLKTLEDCDYLVKEDHTYDISLRFLDLGADLRTRIELFSVGPMAVDNLAAVTGECASLSVQENDQRVLLYTAEGRGVIYNKNIGSHIDLHLTASGKAILAHMPEEEIDRIIRERGLPTSTEKTITDREELFEELTKVRERDYAVEDEENREGIRGISVPVIHKCEPLGSIALVGPKSRFTPEYVTEELKEPLITQVNLIQMNYDRLSSWMAN